MNDATTIAALRALGLNELEAICYVHLVAHSPATGYGVARGVGKPTANTYKALAAMAERGIVTREDDTARLYRAVPPAELLGALEQQFRAHRSRAEVGLASLKPVKVDQRVYPLTAAPQVFERARRMLAAARDVAVLQAPARALPNVQEQLGDAIERDVRVVVRLDVDDVIPGVWMAPAAPVPTVFGLSVDARQLLLADLDGDKVNYAVWTSNPTLAREWHRRELAEMLYAEIEHGLAEGLTTDDVETAVERYRTLRDP